MISVIASFDSVTVPFLFSFTQQTSEFSDSTSWQWTGRFIDFIYIVDIIFAFRTTYIDVVTGDEITQPKLLAKKYLSGSALIDFISAISVLANLQDLGLVMSQQTVDILTSFGLFKIFRITRVTGIINKLKVSSEEKAKMKVLYVLFLLFLFHHMLACILWFLFSFEKYWVPPKDFGYL